MYLLYEVGTWSSVLKRVVPLYKMFSRHGKADEDLPLHPHTGPPTVGGHQEEEATVA